MGAPKDKILEKRKGGLHPSVSDSTTPTRSLDYAKLDELEDRKKAERNVRISKHFPTESKQSNTSQQGVEVQQAQQPATPPVVPAQQASAKPAVQQQPQAEQPTEKVEFTPTPSVITPEQKAEYDAEMRKLSQQMDTSGFAKVKAVLDANNAANAAELRLRQQRRENRDKLFRALGDGIAAFSNLYFTSKGAPSVKYDPLGSLSARANERRDKMEAQRKADEEKAYVRQQNELMRQIQEERQRRADEREENRDKDTAEYRKATLEQNAKQHAETLAMQKYRADQEAEVKKAGFKKDVTVESMKQAGKAADRQSSGYVPIRLRSGEVINVPKASGGYETAIISSVYKALPEEVKAKAFEDFNLGKYTEKKQLTPAQEAQIIGKYLDHPDAEAARNILREISGKETVDEAQATKASKGFSWTKPKEDNNLTKVNW